MTYNLFQMSKNYFTLAASFSAFFLASARIASVASCLALISSLNNSKFDFFFAAVFGFGFSDDLAVGDGMAITYCFKLLFKSFLLKTIPLNLASNSSARAFAALKALLGVGWLIVLSVCWMIKQVS